MTHVQLEQMSSLVNTLRLLQQRMARTKSMFPSHHEELERRYNQLLAEAKQNKITPPWLAA
jgi:hypothetical protein